MFFHHFVHRQTSLSQNFQNQSKPSLAANGFASASRLNANPDCIDPIGGPDVGTKKQVRGWEANGPPALVTCDDLAFNFERAPQESCRLARLAGLQELSDFG